MDLGRIEPHPTIRHAEIRTYQCKECGDTLIQTFGGESNTGRS
jgi:ribosomal protein S27E